MSYQLSGQYLVHKPGVIISTAEFLRPVPYPSSPSLFLNLPVPKNRMSRSAWERSWTSVIFLSSGAGGVALEATLCLQQESTEAEFCPAVYIVESTTVDALPLTQEALVARAPGCNVFLHSHCRMFFSSLLDSVTLNQWSFPGKSKITHRLSSRLCFLFHRNTVADKEEALFWVHMRVLIHWALVKKKADCSNREMTWEPVVLTWPRSP